MKLKTLTLSAATAALLATGAYAQDTAPQPATPPVATPDQPAANKPMPDSSSENPMPNAAADKSAPSADGVATTTTKTTTESIQFTSSAGADDMLASELIGTPVRNAKEDKLGNINDVIMSKDGKPAVAVLGVGGFLGIGEKNVGIPFDSLQFTTDNNKKIARLEVDKQALESAPTFVYPEKPAAVTTSSPGAPKAPRAN